MNVGGEQGPRGLDQLEFGAAMLGSGAIISQGRSCYIYRSHGEAFKAAGSCHCCKRQDTEDVDAVVRMNGTDEGD